MNARVAATFALATTCFSAATSAVTGIARADGTRAAAAAPPAPETVECSTEAAFWMSYAQAMTDAGTLLVAALVPHVGVRMQDDPWSLRPAFAFPWSLAFGPAMASSARVCGTDDHRPHRAVLEPGVVVASPVLFYVRPGYRLLWHAAEWRTGFGAGLGSTVQIVGVPTARASVSPELLLQVGRCCRPGYVLVSLRYDHYWQGTGRNELMASAGITLW
jgi:hypothetical protein